VSVGGGDSERRTTVAALEGRVRRYNSDIDAGSSAFRAAVLLLAAVEFGQNIDTLTRRTGYERSFVARCARRLIDNGVWMGGRTISDWSPQDEASGSFWNDVAVAEGKLCRRLNEHGHIEWAPAGYWKKSYEFIEASGDQPLSTTYRDPTAPLLSQNEEETVDESAGSPTAELEAPAESETAAPQPEPGQPAPPAETPAVENDVPRKELFPNAVWLR
jgi:hypothetical protein